MGFCGINKASNHLIIIRSYTILSADGNHSLITAKPFSHAAHIYRNHLCNILWNGSASAMSYFFIRCNQQIYRSFRQYILFLQIFCKSQKDSCTEFIIQEPAFNKSTVCHFGSGIKTYKIPWHYTQLFHILFGMYQFIQNGLHCVISTLCIAVFTIYMDRSIRQLEGCVILTSVPCKYPAVLCFCIIRIHSSHISQLQPSIAFDLCNHSSQCVHMSCQHNAVILCFFSKTYPDSAFIGKLWEISHFFQFFLHKACCHVGKSTWAWYRQQSLRCLHDVICILVHISSSSSFFILSQKMAVHDIRTVIPLSYDRV